MAVTQSTPKSHSKPMERRAIAPGAQCELRAEPDGKLRGYAVVFNQWADDGWGGVERVLPGAFKKTLKESPDIRALWNHDTSKVLGRTTAGTLKLHEDKRGLAIEIDPPDTQAGRDAVVSISRGDVTQMSFGFNVIKDTETSDEKGNRKRELIELRLHEVSPVTFPFYPTTEVGLRNALSGAGFEPDAVERAVSVLSKQRGAVSGEMKIINCITAEDIAAARGVRESGELPSDTAIVEDVLALADCDREDLLAALSDETSITEICNTIRDGALRVKAKNDEPGADAHSDSENTSAEPGETHSEGANPKAISEPVADGSGHSPSNSTEPSGGTRDEPGQESASVDASHSPDSPDESTVTDPSTANVDDAETQTDVIPKSSMAWRMRSQQRRIARMQDELTPLLKERTYENE